MHVEQVRWVRRWEADVTASEHSALTELLAAIYPAHSTTFRGSRDYTGARPEGRVVGLLGDRPVAHLGFLRRTLRLDTGDESVFCGDVGLVGVHPDHQGKGVGLRLLHEAQGVFDRLAKPYGFLTCRPAVVPFYERAGWRRVVGQVSEMLDNDLRREVNTGPALVLPVHARFSEWPSTRVVVRDGLEV